MKCLYCNTIHWHLSSSTACLSVMYTKVPESSLLLVVSYLKQQQIWIVYMQELACMCTVEMRGLSAIKALFSQMDVKRKCQ